MSQQIVSAASIGLAFSGFDNAVIGDLGIYAPVDDVLTQTAQSQILSGGAGNDTLSGWGAGILDGGAGNDTLLHYGGNNNGVLSRLSGGPGDDYFGVSGGTRDGIMDFQISAGTGKDTLVLHSGDYNIFTADAGVSDLISMAANGGSYRISTFDLGVDGIVFRGSTTQQTFITQNGNDVFLSHAGGDSTAVLIGANAANVASLYGFSII